MALERNVVVLCLDSVRKDFFDDFATGIRSRADLSFEQCRAASSWSVPSHASMISGKLPSEHDTHTHNQHFDDLPREETIFGDLDGHIALGASANVYASPAYGFDRYFDSFYDFRQSNRFPSALNPSDVPGNGLQRYWRFVRESLAHERTVESILNGVIPKVDRLSQSLPPIPQFFDDGTRAVLGQSENQIDSAKEPFVAFCNIMESHIPHYPTRGYDDELYPDVSNDWGSDKYDVWELCENDHPEYWEKRRQMYSATIEYLDRKIVDYIDTVQEATERETTVVITSDHGENHGGTVDEGLANHKSSLSEGLLHIPLEIVNPPSAVTTAVSDLQDRPFSHLELRDILESLAHESAPNTNEWHAILPAEVIGMSGGPDPPDNYEYWDRAIRCCIRDTKKITWDSMGAVNIYEIDTTCPNWQSDGIEIDTVPSWAFEQFETDINEYKRRSKQMAKEARVSSEIKSRLEDLGYR